MRKFIKFITESDQHSLELDREKENADYLGHDFDMAAEIERIFQNIDINLRQRRNVEDVYFLVLDGIPFEDAVGHIAKRAQVDPLDLRSACVDDYKILRARGDTYDHEAGRQLVTALNPIIREAMESYLRDNIQG